MDKSDILQFIGTYIIPLVSAAVGWIAGSRKRRNDFLKDLQTSIDLLSSENRRLLADITAVNAEIVAARKENEELKASVDRLCAENAQLQDEIRLLREQVSEKTERTSKTTASHQKPWLIRWESTSHTKTAIKKSRKSRQSRP